MAEEKLFTIPLRKEFLKAPKYQRTKRAVSAVRAYMVRHMKTDQIKIGKELNLLLWSQGGKHPPSRVKVKAKIEEGVATVELVDYPFPSKEKLVTKEGLKEKLLKKKDEKVTVKETPETRKELEKERMNEEKKEHTGHKKVPGEPEKQATVQEKQKNEKTDQVVHQSGKKDSHSPKP